MILRTWLVIACTAISVSTCHSAAAVSVDAGGCTLHVDVDGLRNSNGVVGVLLFASPDGWPENVAKSVRHEASPIPASQRHATITFADLRAGNYGIVALHDENKNMKLDKNFFGYPREGFGFANNPHIGLAAPAFRSAVLPVGCPTTETLIHMVYK